jgi:hypothetical protein
LDVHSVLSSVETAVTHLIILCSRQPQTTFSSRKVQEVTRLNGIKFQSYLWMFLLSAYPGQTQYWCCSLQDPQNLNVILVTFCFNLVVVRGRGLELICSHKSGFLWHKAPKYTQTKSNRFSNIFLIPFFLISRKNTQWARVQLDWVLKCLLCVHWPSDFVFNKLL